MLEIFVPERELYDEDTQEFIFIKSQTLQLEHSLVSLSKWESKWCKPFLDKKEEKTNEQVIDYIRCMTITQNVKPTFYISLPSESIQQIEHYIDEPMTATWFNETHNGPGTIKNGKEATTAEIIYYWMIVQNIPMECQRWHLNRLLALIRVCAIKNSPPKKMNKQEMFANRKALNESRRLQLNSKG